MHHYSIYHLSIHSELALPELMAGDVKNVFRHDVTIKLGGVSSSGIKNPLATGANFQLSPNLFWLDIPNVARFLVRDGCQITVDPSPEADEASLRLFLHGHCFSNLLIQRDCFVLHGATIQINGQAIMFLADVGVGKSTFVATCLNQGHKLITDDLCAMDLQGNILPGQPNIHLWQDSLSQLNIDSLQVKRLRPAVEKYALPVHQQFHAHSCPVSAVCILSTHSADELKMNPVQGLQKIHYLQQYIFHRKFLKGLGKERLYFEQATYLAQKIPMTHIVRPLHGFHAHAVLDLVEKHVTSYQKSVTQ